MFLTSAEVTLGVGLLTAASGVGGILLGGRVQARRDREQRAQELARERMRLEHEAKRQVEERRARNAERWVEERRSLNARFIEASRDLHGGLSIALSRASRSLRLIERDPEAHEVRVSEVVAEAMELLDNFKVLYANLELIASDDVLKAAQQIRRVLFSLSTEVGITRGLWRELDDGQKKARTDSIAAARRLEAEFNPRSALFIRAARAELGTVTGLHEPDVRSIDERE